MRLFYFPIMSMKSSRGRPRAPRPKSVPKPPALYAARQHELNTKRRGELAELAFTLKAASLGFGVSKPFGDSERYDTIVDARELIPTRNHRCKPDCPTLQAAHGGRRACQTPAHVDATLAHVETMARVETAASSVSRSEARAPAPPASTCPALRVLRTVDVAPPWCPLHPTPPLWRVQIKCSTQLDTGGLYRINAHRRTGGRAVPYLPGEIDCLAAYIIPEDTWYIIPLEAFLGLTSLLLRRRADPKPGLYDEYKEAWHLLRPK